MGMYPGCSICTSVTVCVAFAWRLSRSWRASLPACPALPAGLAPAVAPIALLASPHLPEKEQDRKRLDEALDVYQAEMDTMQELTSL